MPSLPLPLPPAWPGRTRQSPETRLMYSILDALRLVFKGRGMFWRNNTGAVKVEGRFVRFGDPGSPDILGILTGGLFIGLEVKMPGRKPTDLQKEWARSARKVGGEVATVYSVDEALAVVSEALALP